MLSHMLLAGFLLESSSASFQIGSYGPLSQYEIDEHEPPCPGNFSAIDDHTLEDHSFVLNAEVASVGTGIP